MNPIQTGIATALALTVVVLFFILPGLSPFTAPAPVSEITINNEQPASTTMPPETQPITELMMKDDVVGTGAVAAAGDTVTVNYVGALTNGKVFDSNQSATGFTFTLGVGQVIKGWDEGVAGMKEGGKRVLAIPAALAYGSQARGDAIPANSDLIFEVVLLKVQKSAQ